MPLARTAADALPPGVPLLKGEALRSLEATLLHTGLCGVHLCFADHASVASVTRAAAASLGCLAVGDGAAAAGRASCANGSGGQRKFRLRCGCDGALLLLALAFVDAVGVACARSNAAWPAP
eukprot:6208786-Pleurochrysis_carterae.AAC.1